MLAAAAAKPEVRMHRRKSSVEDFHKDPKRFKICSKNLDQERGPVKAEDGQIGILGDQQWPRPPLPKHWDSNNIVFQQIDTEEVFSTGEYSKATIRMFGVTANGNSVMCDIENFRHYFYIAAPHGFTEADIPELCRTLLQNGISVPDQIEIVMKQSLWGYHGDHKVPFLKLVCTDPRKVSRLRSSFESSKVVSGSFVFSEVTYDNIPYALRCAIDRGIVGMSWITLPAGKYTVVPPAKQESKCQIEVTIDSDDLEAHPADGEWLQSAPLRVMSFDIECAGRKGIFPDANIDPVIQIACVVQVQGAKRPFVRNVFTLGTCSPIVGSEVYEHETEEKLLQHWSQFVNQVDPDVIIGYNTTNFDLPYLLDRATALNISHKFAYFGRLKSVRQVLNSSVFSSKAYGTSESKVTNIEGRIQIDMLQYIRREYKLRSYTLNAVSARFLGEQKEDVHHSIITDLQNGDADSRHRLAVYCLKDAVLPLRLLDKLMAFVNMTEMARVTGVPIGYLLTRGQQIKVVSQLFRKALQVGMVIPNMKSKGSDDQYEGATVIEPVRGYYDKPIATLDFSSLYPSIMMAHNLCYTTLLDEATIKELGLIEGVDYIVTPHNDKFVKSSKRHGILPIILEELLSARKRAKADLKKETDPFKKAVLDGRQLALKISANSVYGFTGATVGKLPCLQISSSVTSYGREMIEATKAFVEEHYSKKNGYQHDSKVIYGDTDSVMVRFGVDTLEEAMKLGQEAAGRVSEIFINPIKLEFEKIYFPYLLINKKRYAGLYWTNPNNYDKMDTKGIETVRRDNCQLVQNVIETVLNKILIDRDVNAAKDFVISTIQDLLQNRVDLSLLVISKQLSRADYAGKQAHSELAERMRVRDLGSAPALGDRVPYVIIKGASKDTKNYEKSEDPVYALENNLAIDTNYYLENQLSKPLMRIFEPILGDKASQLLTGEHTLKIKRSMPAVSGLMKFTVKSLVCKGCKRPLSGAYKNGAVCERCIERVPELYSKELTDVNELQTRFNKLWTQCQACHHSMHHDVICASNDCPIFFMRRAVQKDIQKSQEELRRFDYSW